MPLFMTGLFGPAQQPAAAPPVPICEGCLLSRAVVEQHVAKWSEHDAQQSEVLRVIADTCEDQARHMLSVLASLGLAMTAQQQACAQQAETFSVMVGAYEGQTNQALGALSLLGRAMATQQQTCAQSLTETVEHSMYQTEERVAAIVSQYTRGALRSCRFWLLCASLLVGMVAGALCMMWALSVGLWPWNG